VSERYIWKDSFALGIEGLDEEHRAFIDLLNAVGEALDRGDTEAIAGAVEGLRTYAEIHFAHEETYLESIGYPDLLNHQVEHAAYLGRLRDIAAARGGGPRAPLEMARGWLIFHILGTDRRFAVWAHQSPTLAPYPLAY
jgi:hemerythrin